MLSKSARDLSPSAGSSRADSGAPDAAEAWDHVHRLTVALTGLTSGGSEFFIRKGERYIADIQACVDWVRRRDTNAHERTARLIHERRDLQRVNSELLEAVQRARRHATNIGIDSGSYVDQLDAAIATALDLTGQGSARQPRDQQVAGEGSRDASHE